MPTHITARLAWHRDGWDGSVCAEPELNTYCVGPKSYPGDVIAFERDIEAEQNCAGCRGASLEGYVPPCCYSYNAFGIEEAGANSNPPDFFYGGADAHSWVLPPATVCVWPYEAMYGDEVKEKGYFDNDVRRENVIQFFAPIIEDEGHNLLFYYANYSNPLSEEETPRYVLIGVSRIAKVGPELRYENVNDKVAERYGGGMIWARNISARYPDEGLRLPYHRYKDDPELLRRIALFPEDPALCKYGSKHVSDDQAIGLLEQFLDRVRLLLEMGDDSEDWRARETWLLGAIAKLWKHRGLYPGLLRVLEAADATAFIPGTKAAMQREGAQAAHALVFDVLENGATNSVSEGLSEAALKETRRNWRLIDVDARRVAKEVLARLDLTAWQMADILSDDRTDSGLPIEAAELLKNPYLLTEAFVDPADASHIPWSMIDRGMLPLPDTGPAYPELSMKDERRFRALCVEHVRDEPNHCFRFAASLVEEINQRMARLPDWKSVGFNQRYFDADQEFLSELLTLRPTEHGLAVYLRSVFEDERAVEGALRSLGSRPDIALKRPVTEVDWKGWIEKPASDLALKCDTEYRAAVTEQAEICARIFRRPLAIVTGAAGTGKTSVIEALIRAVRRVEGEGTAIKVLAPTGKATDRARQVFEDSGLAGVETVTIHSLLASNGWLKDNLTFRRSGGKREAVQTLIIDEASMLDLELAATLFRAVDWNSVRRLVLVGDAGQLPPIGRGRVFADLLRWVGPNHEGLGRLTTNLRQMLNRVKGDGTAIVRTAELFIVQDGDAGDGAQDAPTRPDQEELVEQLHAGGPVDKDLSVVFWDDPTQLAELLIDTVERRMVASGTPEADRPYKLWQAGLRDDPTRFQILTPNRGEPYGVEALNFACQERIGSTVIDRIGSVDGITLFDKVIQLRNRTRSNPIWAYDWNQRANVKVEVFNGEIGLVDRFGFDTSVQQRLKTGYGKMLSRFVVRFGRKPHLTVGYGKAVPAANGKSRNEKVEDNLELAYAVSVHKAQGSEFANVFVVIPARAGASLSPELVYTALTRAGRHCTLLIQRDVNSLLDARRRENAQTPRIASSLFQLHVPKAELLDRRGWYEAGKIHEALSGDMVRSKSEVIVANLLHQAEVPFTYETLLFADDGTIKLPDFTVTWAGERWYWEHLGLLDQSRYANEWQAKKAWYDRWFPGRLLTTEEGPQLSSKAAALVAQLKGLNS